MKTHRVRFYILCLLLCVTIFVSGYSHARATGMSRTDAYWGQDLSDWIPLSLALICWALIERSERLRKIEHEINQNETSP